MIASRGAPHWRVQRLTALALIPLGLWLLLSLPGLQLAEYGAVRAWVAAPWHAVFLSLLLLCLCWHSQLGVQVVIEDYVHDKTLNTISLRLSILLHLLLCGAGVFAILRTVFTAPALTQGMN
jgi:succinate dehydrogenase / fumarate reductase membrane anchor subunit